MASSARHAAPAAVLLLLVGCGSNEKGPDPEVRRLQEENDVLRSAAARKTTEAELEAQRARDELELERREAARLRDEVAELRASNDQQRAAAEAAMGVVRRQEAELVELRKRPDPGAEGGVDAGAAKLLLELQKQNKELRNALADARAGGASDAGPRPWDKGVRASGVDLEKPVALVNSAPLTRREFVEFLYRDLATPQLLSLFVDRHLVLRAAADRGVTVTDVEQAVWVQEQLVAQTQEAGGEAKLAEKLRELGFTREVWEARLRYQARSALLLRRLIDQDRAGGQGREAFAARVRATWQAEMSERVKASHILVAVPPGAPPEEEAAARKKAESLRDAARRNVPFADLSRRYSDDPESRKIGGSLGSFDRLRFQAYPELNTALFTLPPGQASDPIRSRMGFHVLLVEDRQAAKRPFDEATRKELEARLLKEMPDDAEVAAFLKRLRDGAQVTPALTFDE
jgi:peptidyl-prolyl cis-trans isomerase C